MSFNKKYMKPIITSCAGTLSAKGKAGSKSRPQNYTIKQQNARTTQRNWSQILTNKHRTGRLAYPQATISCIASLTFSFSDLTANFIATSFVPSIPKDNRTSTFTLPMYTPDNKHVCDLELLGTVSVPCNKKWKKMHSVSYQKRSVIWLGLVFLISKLP